MEYNKLNFKNIGPCQILRKFFANSYELEMPARIGIYPIFNVVDLYPYVADDTSQLTGGKDPSEYFQWLNQMPMAQPLEAEDILHTRVAKSTRKKDYLEYLVKWKERPIEYSTWMNVVELESKGFTVVDLMNKVHDFSPLGV